MSSSVTPLGRFLNQLKAFADVLLLLYPEDKYFKLGKTYLEIGVSTNPRMVHTLFKDHVLKFKDEIID